MIKGGYYIKARKIQESGIAHAPPHVREIWDWLIQDANHAPFRNLKRGQTIRSIKEIREALHWKVGYRKERYSITQCENAMKYFRNAEMIATTKAGHGTIITICNYDTYQDQKNYESRNDCRNDCHPHAEVLPNQIQEEEKEKEINITLSDIKNMSDSDRMKPKNNSIVPDKTKDKIYQETEKCMPLARTLARIVQSQKDIEISNKIKWSWANEIRKLIFTVEMVPYTRVETALSWYRQNVSREYVPVIESGYSLRKKFTKLEDAIRRDKTSTSRRALHGAQKSKYDDNYKVIKMSTKNENN